MNNIDDSFDHSIHPHPKAGHFRTGPPDVEHDALFPTSTFGRGKPNIISVLLIQGYAKISFPLYHIRD